MVNSRHLKNYFIMKHAMISVWKEKQIHTEGESKGVKVPKSYIVAHKIRHNIDEYEICSHTDMDPPKQEV